MNKLVAILYVSILLISCESNTNVKSDKEMELLERELDLKERELILKESINFENTEDNSDYTEGNYDTTAMVSDNFKDNESQIVELQWNYSGSIGNYPIKAQLDFLEATHSEGTGAVNFPIKGYYFYESKNKKIPLEGDANGVGMIFLTAYTNGGNEYFDGEVIGDAMLEDFSGTWSKNDKSLPFTLLSR